MNAEERKNLDKFIRLINTTIKCAKDVSKLNMGHFEICPAHWHDLLKGFKNFKSSLSPKEKP